MSPALAGFEAEREAAVAVWRAWAGDTPKRVAVLQGRGPDALVDGLRVADGRALCAGGQVLRIERIDDTAAEVARLAEFAPEVLMVPSLRTVAWLERLHRAPVEQLVPSLRLVLVEFDLRARVRTRLPVHATGWALPDAPARLTVPSPRAALAATTLAMESCLLELLPHGDPEFDGRRTYASEAIWPEQARLGGRYEVVVTSPMGLLRLRTGVHLRVVGFDMPWREVPVPRPRVVRLPPAPADVRLEGCTLAGAWLTAAVRQAFLPEDPALVAAEVRADPESASPDAGPSASSMHLPAAFAETELGGAVRPTARPRRGRRPRGLWARVEVQGVADPRLPGALARRVDQDLRRRSPAYDHLRGRGELHPVRVELLEGGSFREQEARRIRRLRGPVWAPEVLVVG